MNREHDPLYQEWKQALEARDPIRLQKAWAAYKEALKKIQ